MLADSSLWNPITCFCACALIYVIAEFFSNKTNGNVSSLLFASFFFLSGFWFKILPVDVTTRSGLVAAMGNFGVALLITNLGTLIDLETLISEWKTVAIAFFGLFGIALVAFTIGPVLFGREYALIAAPPIAGGTIAGLIVQNAANDAGRPELAAYAVLVLAFQSFFGLPIATVGLKREIKRKMEKGEFSKSFVPEKKSSFTLPSMRIFPEPTKKASSNTHLFKLAFVASIAFFIGTATRIPGDGPANYWLNPNIAYLLFGLIFTRIGFLEKSSLQKSDSYGITMFGLMMMLPGSLALISPSQLLAMVLPLAGMLALCAIAINIIATLVGKLVGYSPFVSWAIASTCMFGYPATEILSNEVTRSMDADDETKARALEYVLPKMIVGGFVTVTIASVAFAGIVAPMIFF